jgi:hypothetical protein
LTFFFFFFFQNAPSHCLFFYFFDEKEICWGGRTTPAYFFYFFFWFFGFFFFFWKNKIKYKIEAFWEKKRVKVVELPQFESLGGKVSHLKLWRQKCKSVNISGEVKCNFSQYFAI